MKYFTKHEISLKSLNNIECVMLEDADDDYRKRNNMRRIWKYTSNGEFPTDGQIVIAIANNGKSEFLRFKQEDEDYWKTNVTTWTIAKD